MKSRRLCGIGAVLFGITVIVFGFTDLTDSGIMWQFVFIGLLVGTAGGFIAVPELSDEGAKGFCGWRRGELIPWSQIERFSPGWMSFQPAVVVHMKDSSIRTFIGIFGDPTLSIRLNRELGKYR